MRAISWIAIASSWLSFLYYPGIFFIFPLCVGVLIFFFIKRSKLKWYILKVGRQGNSIMITNESTDLKNVTVNIFTATGQRKYSSAKRSAAGVNAITVPGNINQALFVQVMMENKEVRMFKVY